MFCFAPQSHLVTKPQVEFLSLNPQVNILFKKRLSAQYLCVLKQRLDRGGSLFTGWGKESVESVTFQTSRTFLSNQGRLSLIFKPKKKSKLDLGFTNAINSAFWSQKTRAAAVIKVQGEHMECFINIYLKRVWHIMLLETWPKDCSAKIFKMQRNAGGKFWF